MPEENTPKRYRTVIKKTLLIDQHEVVVDTLPNVKLIAPITGIIDGQNGSELFSIPGVYGDCAYSAGYVKETGEIKLYSSTTSLSEKEIMLIVYYEKLEET